MRRFYLHIFCCALSVRIRRGKYSLPLQHQMLTVPFMILISVVSRAWLSPREATEGHMLLLLLARRVSQCW